MIVIRSASGWSFDRLACMTDMFTGTFHVNEYVKKIKRTVELSSMVLLQTVEQCSHSMTANGLWHFRGRT